MKHTSILLAFLVAAVGMAAAEPAEAARNGRGRGLLRSAERLMHQQQKLARRLERLVDQMSPEARLDLLSRSAELLDSDGDGLPDALENASGSDSCDEDSDDDGVNDGEDPDPDEPGDGEDEPGDDEPGEDEPGEDEPGEDEPGDDEPGDGEVD